jgi:hypothetical protein
MAQMTVLRGFAEQALEREDNLEEVRLWFAVAVRVDLTWGTAEGTAGVTAAGQRQLQGW